MKPSASRPRRPRKYQKHGLTSLKSAVNKLGGRVIDKRTTLGKSLATWRANVVADKGGADALSTQQLALVDLAVRTKLMLDSIDAWILTQPSLVSARKRALIPVVRERASLAATFQALLKDLGLARVAKDVKSLGAILGGTTPTRPQERAGHAETGAGTPWPILRSENGSPVPSPAIVDTVEGRVLGPVVEDEA